MMAGEAPHFWLEFLSSQDEYNRLGPDRALPRYCYEARLYDFLCAFNGASRDYSDLDLVIPEHMPLEKMASNPVSMSFLQFLIRMRRPKRFLEIGSYIGVSAIRFVQSMPFASELTTIELGEEFARLTRINCDKNLPQSELPRYLQGDALNIVKQWASSEFLWHEDMIFLDADKDHYDEYLEPLSTLLAPGGLLVVDDVLFHGDVLNKTPTTEKGAGCARLLAKAKDMPWWKVLLPLGNGILLMQKPL